MNEHRHPNNDVPRLPETDPFDPRALFTAVESSTAAGMVAAVELNEATEPVELEIGCARGEFVLERLAADPRTRILGLEIRRKWAAIAARRLAARNEIHRARVFAEDARQVLPRFVDGSLRRIYVHFPDPWWKKRHQKRLVVNPDLVVQAARLLCPGGEFFVQTDVQPRAEMYRELFLTHPDFELQSDHESHEVDRFGARSARERRAIQDGLPVVRLSFIRR